MLRNVPNQGNYHDLEARLDQICAGKYDFTYLRIDFEKATNVGYGSINLTHQTTSGQSSALWAAWQATCHRSLVQHQSSTAAANATNADADADVALQRSPPSLPRCSLLPRAESNGRSRPFIGTEKPFPQPNNHTRLVFPAPAMTQN
ncbi:Putative mei2-like RNA recognition [Septoria linicola]|uniref:Mei2-like RNA recognition n=1 Tax=Septoria linicola TaxID=215465 RepID=A0A9Q9EPJ6_9PEZI|nr:putative mei2-like RNA recognition [Septoria linicola]USW58170.1 Putative mei2-like RNA recognition [Septoria linicola]